MNNNYIDVIKHPSKGWAIKRKGASRCLKTFKEPFDAIVYARELGKKEGLTVFYHNENGRVYNRDIFTKGYKDETNNIQK